MSSESYSLSFVLLSEQNGTGRDGMGQNWHLNLTFQVTCVRQLSCDVSYISFKSSPNVGFAFLSFFLFPIECLNFKELFLVSFRNWRWFSAVSQSVNKSFNCFDWNRALLQNSAGGSFVRGKLDRRNRWRLRKKGPGELFFFFFLGGGVQVRESESFNDPILLRLQ